MHSPDFNAHGFLRVAASTPVVSIADPMANADAILAQLEDLTTQHVAVAVFPELCLSAYTAEDLFFTEKLLGELPPSADAAGHALAIAALRCRYALAFS